MKEEQQKQELTQELAHKISPLFPPFFPYALHLTNSQAAEYYSLNVGSIY